MTDGKIISYHPALEADTNLLLVSQRPLGPHDERAVAAAAAVLLPQSPRPDLHALVKAHAKPHFPRAEVQLNDDGKVGNHRLFTRLGLDQPETVEFGDLAAAVRAWRQGRVPGGGGAPLVAKGAGGGEGRNVFLVRGPDELHALGPRLETRCARGPDGLVLQEYIDTGGRDLRVIFIGPWEDAFWRVADGDDFRTNLSQAGRIVRGGEGPEMARAVEMARRLRQAAELDVAAVDMVVTPDGRPLLLEINFAFGRRALGGTGPFLKRYLEAVRYWLQGLGLDPVRVRLAV